MSYSFTEQTGDGTTVSFTFSFVGEDYGYYDEDDIHVQVNGTEVPFFLTGANQVTLNYAPANGAKIRILRIPNPDTPYTDFHRGNQFGENNINRSFLKQLYLMHRIMDGFKDKGYYEKQDLSMGTNYRIKDMADPIEDTDAATKKYVDMVVDLENPQGEGEQNVQSDWNETDTDSDAYIQNKPDVISSPVILKSEDETIRVTEDGAIRVADLTMLSFHKVAELQDINSSGSGDIITDTERNNLNINTTHRSKIDNPHQVTKAQVGLGEVPNTDFTSAVNANTAHKSITTGNPHNVTKADIGLSNVQDGAEQNVQSDWNETNVYSDAYIQNKSEAFLNILFHTNWENITDKAPSGNVLYQEFQRVYNEIDKSVSNEPYSSDWEGLISQAPSKDALYEKFESLTAGGGYMVYPDAGIPQSTGTAWGASLGLDTTTLSNNNHLATVQAIKAYGDANWGGGSGGGLWSDLTSYYKPDNTDTFGLYDTGQVRLNNNGNQTLPGTENTYNPYCLGYSDSLNIYDDTTTRGTAGLVAQKKVTTHLTQSDGSPYSDTKSDTQPGAALFLTHHTTNNVSGIYNVVTGNVNTIGGVYGDMPDSIGIHNRVIKFSDTKNNAFGEWNFIERKACTNVPQGNIAGAETNLLNIWCSFDSNRNKVYRTGVNNTHVYMQEFKNPVDNMYFGNSAIGWTISGIDSNDGTYGMMEAAIHIAPMQLTAVPAWANGILFSKHDSSPSDCYGAISPLIGTCINMVSALPKWGLKFGDVGAGGAHLYSTGDTIVQTGNGAKTFTLKGDGILEVPSVIRCTGTYGGTNHGTVLALVNDTSNQLAFGYEAPYLTIYFNGTKVRKITTLDL